MRGVDCCEGLFFEFCGFGLRFRVFGLVGFWRDGFRGFEELFGFCEVEGTRGVGRGGGVMGFGERGRMRDVGEVGERESVDGRAGF